MTAYSMMREGDKGIPVAVELDAAQLQQRLGPLLDPAHPALVKSLRDEVPDGALDDTAAEFEVLTRQLLVVHHCHALGQVVGGLREPRLLLGSRSSASLARRARTIESALPE